MNPRDTVARKIDGVNEPLIPAAFATDVSYAVAVEIDDSDKYDASCDPAIGRVVTPSRFRQDLPDMHEIADQQSKKIERDIMRGQKDGNTVVTDERVGFLKSKSEANHMSSGITQAVRSSAQNDDLDPLYRQQRQSVVDPIAVTKDEMQAKEEERYQTDGYKVADYTCIYEEGGKTFYDEKRDGYKVHDYKSEYNV